MSTPSRGRPATRILIVGGGHVGLNVARRLGRRLGRGAAEVVVVDPRSHLAYQPLLAEAAAGNVEPRHVAVPLRRVLHRHPWIRVISAELTELNHGAHRAVVRLSSGEHRELAYDHVVLAPGSVSRALPIPGLAELGVGFRTIGEAVYLRNEILDRLAFASSTMDDQARRRALTFVVVGGGYSGIEALGELSDMSAAVAATFHLDPADLRWVLVEAADRVLPEVSAALAGYTVDVLRRRGVEVRLRTVVLSCVDGRVALAPTGSTEAEPTFEADTLVWTAGVRPNPVLAATGLPRDDRGRLLGDVYLRVRGVPGAWTAGDGAAIPDVTAGEPGATCAPTAQHAVRQARRLADNLAAVVRDGRPRPYRHRYAGSVASLGRFQGVAETYGIRTRGFPAWLLHRAYHLAQLPSVVRRAHVLADWTLAAIFPRDIVSLGEVHEPRASFVRAVPAPDPIPDPIPDPVSGSAPAEVAADHASTEHARPR